jgi:hypothetical protein
MKWYKYIEQGPVDYQEHFKFLGNAPSSNMISEEGRLILESYVSEDPQEVVFVILTVLVMKSYVLWNVM